MNNIGLKTYEHIKELLYNKVNKEITISSEAMNYVFDYVDDLQNQLDSCIKSNKEKQRRIDKAIKYIENDMPYLEESDEEFERCDGTTYMTMKEYDTSVLLNILGDEIDE